MIKCAIVGGSGYIGGELIRLLLSHPQVELVAITANEMAGLPIADIHPNFSHLHKTFNSLTHIEEAETVFLALPHGKAMTMVASFTDKVIIDTSADFRLHDESEFEKFYKFKHSAFHHTPSFCYGLPELFAAEIKKAKNIAAPGCFATAITLAIFPLIAAGLSKEIIVNAVTGSSGSGIKPKASTHHPFREDSFFSYESFTHRHVPEIKQALFEKTGHAIELIFQPHSGPFIRGIYVTAIIQLSHPIDQETLDHLYKKYYAEKFFIRLLDHAPNIKWVKNTNFCDLNVKSNGNIVIVTAAIDNLLKGGAAQAIQCFNLLNQFNETTGLNFYASHP